VRRDELPAGTNLAERLRSAHEAYERQGWKVSPLRLGAWGFTAERDARRLLVAIRAGILVSVAATSSATTTH